MRNLRAVLTGQGDPDQGRKATVPNPSRRPLPGSGECGRVDDHEVPQTLFAEWSHRFRIRVRAQYSVKVTALDWATTIKNVVFYRQSQFQDKSAI
ncbi:MAG: hypothetical protein ACJASV_001528 [Pseudorhodobacter sp.]|jgi:hypothetical protein